MPFKNSAITVTFLVWDSVNGVGKTGDAANITLRGVGDGTEYTPSSPSITEMDNTNLKGVYKAALTAGENNSSFNMIGGISSTTGCLIQPVSWTTETNANLVSILLTAITEGAAGRIAAAFIKFFNIASATGTVNALPDAVPGASGGLPTTNGTKVNQTVDLTAGQSVGVTGDLSDTMKTSVETATGSALATFFTSAAALVTSIWAATTRTLTAAVDSSGVTTLLSLLTPTRAGYLDNLSAGAVATQTSVDDLPTNAELATALAAADDAVLAAVAAVDAKTTNLPSDPADQSLIIAATNALGSAIAALNNLSSAQAQAACAAALAAYNAAVTGAAMTLASGERDAVAAALLDLANGIETGVTLRKAQRLQLSVAAGKVSGMEANAPAFRDVNDTKDRVTAETDADGNRLSVTTDAT